MDPVPLALGDSPSDSREDYLLFLTDSQDCSTFSDTSGLHFNDQETFYKAELNEKVCHLPCPLPMPMASSGPQFPHIQKDLISQVASTSDIPLL